MSLSLRLRAERKAISEQMRGLLNSTSPNAAEQWAKLDQAQEALRVRIASVEQDGIERDLSDNRNSRQLPNLGTEEFSTEPDARTQARSTSEYEREFRSWLKNGHQGPEMRALSVGSDGVLVPIGFENELEQKLKYYNGLYNICRTVVTPTGNPLHWPNADDTGNTGEWLTEASGVGSADPSFSEIVFGANLLSSKQVKVSIQIEQDSAFPLPSVLSDMLGERCGRSLDTALWSGDGSTVPITGLKTALVAAGGRSVLAVGAGDADGVSTEINSVGPDDLSNLIDKVDRAYQTPDCQFVFNQTTLNALRKLKDKYGRSLWQVSMATGVQDQLYGYNYTVDNAVDNIGAGTIPVAFGSPRKYVIRRAAGFTLVRLDQLYMANYQVGYQAFLRLDAKLIQPAAWSYLQTPLS